MKERPIIFSGEMVRTILDGRKTQARRVIKPQPSTDHYGHQWMFYSNPSKRLQINLYTIPKLCPYGQPDDRLWVRESFAPERMASGETRIEYKADGGSPPPYVMNDGREIPCSWKPSIHMPCWASRIILEITEVRVERLQEIGVEDAIAEGCIPELKGKIFKPAIGLFRTLWDSLNAKRGYGWETNPWVWEISFRKIG